MGLKEEIDHSGQILIRVTSQKLMVKPTSGAIRYFFSKRATV